MADKTLKTHDKQISEHSWNGIEEATPDEWDRQILQEIANDPDCHEFLSSQEAMKTLGL